VVILLSFLDGLERCLLSTDNASVTIENSSVKRYAACYFTRAEMSMISGNARKRVDGRDTGEIHVSD